MAYLPSESRVRLRLSIKGDDKHKLNDILDHEAQKLKNIIPEFIYGEEKDRIEQRIGNCCCLIMQQSQPLKALLQVIYLI